LTWPPGADSRHGACPGWSQCRHGAGLWSSAQEQDDENDDDDQDNQSATYEHLSPFG